MPWKGAPLAEKGRHSTISDASVVEHAEMLAFSSANMAAFYLRTRQWCS
jgi:hypothetical protein